MNRNNATLRVRSKEYEFKILMSLSLRSLHSYILELVICKRSQHSYILELGIEIATEVSGFILCRQTAPINFGCLIKSDYSVLKVHLKNTKFR